jgi:hypothetical protein
MKNLAQLNPNVRSLYENIIKKNIVYNPQYNLEQFPELYQNPKKFQRMIGGTRLQQTVTSGNDGHFPSIEQVEDNDSGGFYGRTRYSHPISGGMRKPSRSSIGILKQRVPTGLVNDMEMNYIPSGEYHGSGRPPRLTNAIKQKILMMHPELQQIHMSGGAINWNKIWSNIKKSASFVSKAAPIVSSLAPEEYRDTINKTGDISGKISGLGRRKSCKGGNAKQFFKDFSRGFKIGAKGANKVASKVLPIASILAPELMPLAAASVAADQAFGKGRRKKATLPKSGRKRNTARGDIVSAIMRQRGVSLGQASRIVKQEGLY